MRIQANRDFEIVAEGFGFIEAPRTSPEGHVWFADLVGKGVYRKRPGHGVEAMLPERQWVGGIVFDESGKVLCSGRGGIVGFDPATGETVNLLDEIEGEAVIAVNDMEADGRGGLFGGTIDFVSIFETNSTPEPGKLFHMSAAGDIKVLRRDVSASNGLALSPCGKWLYHSETSRGVWRYALGADGMPGEGTLIVELPDSDGLVMDVEGGFWVACWESGRLLHYDAHGVCTQCHTFPQPHIVSLDFGADDPGLLTISTGGNANMPQAGAVLRIKVDTPGLPGKLTRLKTLEKHG
ncbi:MAG: SMP-30/gluconolactonase/LRE family protein [Sphingomonadaceae bacterium]